MRIRTRDHLIGIIDGILVYRFSPMGITAGPGGIRKAIVRAIEIATDRDEYLEAVYLRPEEEIQLKSELAARAKPLTAAEASVGWLPGDVQVSSHVDTPDRWVLEFFDGETWHAVGQPCTTREAAWSRAVAIGSRLNAQIKR